MNTHGEFDEKPLTLHKRTCELTNVSFTSGKLSYFMDPDEERLVSRHDRIDGFAKDDFVLLGKRDVKLNVRTVYAPVPKTFSWSRSKVAIYQSHLWSENCLPEGIVMLHHQSPFLCQARGKYPAVSFFFLEKQTHFNRKSCVDSSHLIS